MTETNEILASGAYGGSTRGPFPNDNVIGSCRGPAGDENATLFTNGAGIPTNRVWNDLAIV